MHTKLVDDLTTYKVGCEITTNIAVMMYINFINKLIY